MSDVARDLALYFAFMTAAMSILSLPLAPATLLAVKTASPWIVALVASSAAAGASVFDHWFVRRAFNLRALVRLRERQLFQKAEGWARVAPFATTLAFAGLPLPFTIARVLIPLSGYPLGRYVAAVTIGRFFRVLAIALFGTVVDIPTPWLVGALVAGLVAAALAATARRLGWLRRFGGATDASEG